MGFILCFFIIYIFFFFGGGGVSPMSRNQAIHGHIACHLTVHGARDLLYMTLSCMLDWKKQHYNVVPLTLIVMSPL